MSRPASLLVCAALIALTAGSLVASTQAKSVWGGVYSVEQADRGRRLYVRECARCHGESLLGAEGGPALAGDEFLGPWNKKTVGALYDVIRTTMPDEAPGSMTERQYTDIVAYLLKENAFPAGKDELPPTLDVMTGIAIVPKP